MRRYLILWVLLAIVSGCGDTEEPSRSHGRGPVAPHHWVERQAGGSHSYHAHATIRGVEYCDEGHAAEDVSD